MAIRPCVLGAALGVGMLGAGVVMVCSVAIQTKVMMVPASARNANGATHSQNVSSFVGRPSDGMRAHETVTQEW